MVTFRGASESDNLGLIRLWNRSFGDPENLIKDFLNHFGTEIGVVGIQDGIIACAAYILPTVGIHMPGAGRLSCSYIYAVAVLPEYRGSGLGQELTKAALYFSNKRGFEYSVLKPSDRGLFEFYRKLGFRDFFRTKELSFYKRELLAPDAKSRITSVSGEEYQTLREDALSGAVHIIPSAAGISYQAKLGWLFGLKLGQSAGCAAVEKYGDTAYIKEMIVPEKDIPEAVSLISEMVPATVYHVRVPAYNKGASKPNGMIYPSLKTEQKNPFLGLAFD